MKEKKIEDFIHLYLGCDVCFMNYEFGKLVGVSASEVEEGKTIAIIDVGSDHFIEWYVEEVKLLLRPLSSMTEEEAREYNIRKQRKGYMSTVHGENTLWLISKHFDIFGLIHAGLALDKTLVKN